MTYYDILEVSENASNEVIRMAYKALVKKYHPDVYEGDKKVAEEQIKKINEAYEILSDPVKRNDYNQKIKGVSQNSKEEKRSNQQEFQEEKYKQGKNEQEKQYANNKFKYRKTETKRNFSENANIQVPVIFQWKVIFLVLVLTILCGSKILFFISLILMGIRFFLGQENSDIQLHGTDKMIAVVFCGFALLGSLSVFLPKDDILLNVEDKSFEIINNEQKKDDSLETSNGQMDLDDISKEVSTTVKEIDVVDDLFVNGIKINEYMHFVRGNNGFFDSDKFDIKLYYPEGFCIYEYEVLGE